MTHFLHFEWAISVLHNMFNIQYSGRLIWWSWPFLKSLHLVSLRSWIFGNIMLMYRRYLTLNLLPLTAVTYTPSTPTYKRTPPPVPPRSTSKPLISITAQSSTESTQDAYHEGQLARGGQCYSSIIYWLFIFIFSKFLVFFSINFYFSINISYIALIFFSVLVILVLKFILIFYQGSISIMFFKFKFFSYFF